MRFAHCCENAIIYPKMMKSGNSYYGVAMDLTNFDTYGTAVHAMAKLSITLNAACSTAIL